MEEEKKYKSVIQEDENGELFIEFPPELIEKLKWDENTPLVMKVNKKGEIILKKK